MIIYLFLRRRLNLNGLPLLGLSLLGQATLRCTLSHVEGPTDLPFLNREIGLAWTVSDLIEVVSALGPDYLVVFLSLQFPELDTFLADGWLSAQSGLNLLLTLEFES